MNNERETKTITTPISGVEVVLKSYLTGREKRDITNSSLPTSVNYDGDEGVSGLNPVAIINNAEDMALKTVIISIGGEAPQNAVDTVLNMQSKDSDFIIAAVKEILDGLTGEKKTT